MTPLNFDELVEHKTKKIYVVNNTAPASLVSLSMADNSGKLHHGEIPKTWIPICLTDLFPRRVLRDNIDIRSFFNKGILKLISEKEAMKIMTQSGAQEESDRLTKSKLASRGGQNYHKASKDMREAAEDVKKMQIEAEGRADARVEGEIDQPLIGDSVVDICNRVINNITSASEILNELKRMRQALSKEELEYIITQVDNKQINKFAKELLAEVSNENNQSFEATENMSSENENEEANESDADDDDEDSLFDEEDEDE